MFQLKLAPKPLWQSGQKQEAAAPSKPPENVGALQQKTQEAAAPSKRMPAEVFREGDAMQYMASEIVRDLLGEPTLAHNVQNGRRHTFATLCSGSELPSVAIDIAQKVLKDNGIKHTFQQVYMCEIEPRKQKWCMEAQPHEQVCCFGDITHLHVGRAICARHGNCTCVVRPADGLIVGVSCKDFARSNPNRWMQRGQVLSGDSSPGKSADTFWGLMRLLDSESGKTSWLIIENSDMLLEHDASVDWGVMLEAIQARGFTVRALITNSVYFATPMHRRRSYLLCLNFVWRAHTMQPSDSPAWKAEFLRVLSKCRMQPPSLLDVLLPADAEELVTELAEFQQKGSRHN